MRWFVEVTEADGGAAVRSSVEAPDWESALALACAERGLAAPLRPHREERDGSIVLLVDLATGTRFELRPEGALPVFSPPSWLIPTRMERSPSEAPTIVDSPLSLGPPLSLADSFVATRLAIPAVRVSDLADGEPPPPSSRRPLAQTLVSAAPPESVAATMVSPAPPSSPSPAQGELFLSREEPPDAHRAWTRRWLAWVVPPGTSNDAATRILLAEFARQSAALATAAPGQLLELEVYDHRFAGAPVRRPIARLVWRDWQGPVPEIHVGDQLDEELEEEVAPTEVQPSAPAARLATATTLVTTAPHADAAESARRALDALLGRVPADAAIVHAAEPGGRELAVVHASGAAALRGVRTPLGDPLLADARAAGRPVVVPDVGRDDRVAGERWARLAVAVRAVACAPAVHEGRLLGAIELCRSSRRFDEREAAELADAAARLAVELAAGAR